MGTLANILATAVARLGLAQGGAAHARLVNLAIHGRQVFLCRIDYRPDGQRMASDMNAAGPIARGASASNNARISNKHIRAFKLFAA